MYVTTYVRPQASQIQGQPWDSAIMEQWSAAIATPFLRAAHMGLVGSHDMGTEFMWQVSLETRKV